MMLTLLAMIPFLGASWLVLMPRAGRNLLTGIAIGHVILALVLLTYAAAPALSGLAAEVRYAWVPDVGLQFTLRLDALGMLFAGLILGIGLLIILYARFYLPAREPLGRFLSLLLLFQGAMLGVALAGNLLLLLIFWELTSLTSFLLIGFRNEKAQSRRGARMALAVTGGGGLALIGGLMLLGHVAGSYEIAEILVRGDRIRSSPLYPPALILILLGCFSKSAQFPFHFWLPRAMAAPTPVSAYLHSATMVKAGIFLLARFWPVLSGTDLWFHLVATTGLVTMLVGAAIALFRNDLKAILAYSTVSQLGLITMLLGFGTPAAVQAAMFHLLNHALFKAALFMNAGIVDHEAGTRDIRRLGGLARLMPVTAALGTIAAASMAGLPPLGGFLSKEMMLEEAAHTAFAGIWWAVPLAVSVAATFSVAYSLRFIAHLYFGPVRPRGSLAPHDPSPGLWAPAVPLIILTMLIGFAPAWTIAWLIRPAVSIATGGAAPPFHPALWHGLTPALAMSAVALVVGGLMLWLYGALLPLARRMPVPDGSALFHEGVERLVAFARALSDHIHNGSLQRQLALMVVVAVGLGIEAIWSGGYAAGTRQTIEAPPVAIAAWALLIAAAAAVALGLRYRFLTLIYISVIGLVVSLAFVYLSAPDLALTQISVEVVTILLLLLALNLMPKQPVGLVSRVEGMRNGLLAVAGGAGAGMAAWAVMTRPPNDPISAFHWANSYKGGGGTNVVNVTLVDFRAFDTFGEIIVLGIAALTIFALLQPAARGVSGQRLRQWIADLPRSPERHPMMFAVAARLLLPLAMMVAVYIFLRGHNAPGGGFIAGLVVSIAFLMQYMASGFEWADQRRPVDEHLLIGAGITLAALTGLGALLFGAPLFTSAFGHVSLPVVGSVELATAMAFDIGVAMAVVGAVMLALAELSHISQRAQKEEPLEDGPMDIDPGKLWEAQR